MKTGTMVGIGIGAALAYLFFTRGLGAATRTVTVQTAQGPVAVQVPNVSSSQVSSAMAQQREAAIQRLMTYSHLSRTDAEARYAQLAPSVTLALTAMHGIGSYYAC